MRLWFRMAGTLLGVVLGASCTSASTDLTEAHAVAIRDSVAAALSRFQRFSSVAEWDSVAAHYSTAPGFRFAESGAVEYRSAAEIRSALAQVPPGTRIETVFRDTDIDPIAPGIAMVTTLFETSFVDSAGGAFSFGGVVTMLWTHEASGWRVRAGHSSVPVPRGNR